jgi:predicted acetylornithine/succinylornithine family transaminase
LTGVYGKSSQEYIDAARGALFPNYRQFPIVFTSGSGTRLRDTEGKEYIDFVAGIATCNLGHCHPGVTRAIVNQAGRLVHVSNWYYSDVQAILSERLTSLTSLDRVFFCNSGAEASETAIKLARKRSFEKYGAGRNLIISFYGAFHGRTMKALTATDPKHHLEAFSPYPEGFVHVAPGDLEGLEGHLPGASALFVEPVQGEGGVNPMGRDFLLKAADLCRKHDVLFMLDEVQTGMGRCGALFAHQLLGIEPDVMTLAKGLANGFPIGAVLTTSELAASLGPGTHGSTFGGNPLACSAALATLNILEADDLPRKAAIVGGQLRAGLEKLGEKHSLVTGVRGLGLLLGMELSEPAAPFVQALMKKGFLVTTVAEKTLRFTPPLNITAVEVNGVLNALDEIFTESAG